MSWPQGLPHLARSFRGATSKSAVISHIARVHLLLTLVRDKAKRHLSLFDLLSEHHAKYESSVPRCELAWLATVTWLSERQAAQPPGSCRLPKW